MDFTYKAQWVKDSYKTDDPESSNFDRVVSRDSIRILFIYAAINDLDVCAADINRFGGKRLVPVGGNTTSLKKGCISFNLGAIIPILRPKIC